MLPNQKLILNFIFLSDGCEKSKHGVSLTIYFLIVKPKFQEMKVLAIVATSTSASVWFHPEVQSSLRASGEASKMEMPEIGHDSWPDWAPGLIFNK